MFCKGKGKNIKFNSKARRIEMHKPRYEIGKIPTNDMHLFSLFGVIL